MIGLLAIPERLKDIRDSMDESDIHFFKIGPFSPDDFLQHAQAAAAINLTMLIVDIDCTDELSLVKGLRIFRAQRNTRIILVAPGRKPGDSTIAALLPLQVWDIVAPELQAEQEEVEDEEGEDDDEREYRSKESYLTFLLSQQIKTASSYGNAARWDVEITQQPAMAKQKPVKQAPEQKRPKEPKELIIDQSLINFIEDIQLPPEKVREVHVYRDRQLGPTVIAIAGATRRSGATYAALQAAAWLSKEKRKTAIVEIEGASPSGLSSYEDISESEKIENGFILEDIHIYPSATTETLAQAFMGQFDFIVIDFGWLFDSEDKSRINPDHIREFARAHIHILTMGSSLRDEEEALLAFDYLLNLKWKQKLHFLVNFATDDSFERIQGVFGSRQKKELNVLFHHSDLMTNPFVPDNESYADVLDSFVKKKKGFRLFRKG